MRLLKFNILVVLPILLQYVVHGVSFDYAQPDDFRHSLLSDGAGSEELTGDDVTDEEGYSGQDSDNSGVKGYGKNGPGQFIQSEDVTVENLAEDDPINPFDPDYVDDPTGRCPYGLVYRRNCYLCYCDPKTRQQICNTKVCGNGNCPYGETYTIDCNTCKCDKRTQITRCTRKKCDKGTFSRCVYGKHYMKDCNKCTCSIATGTTTCTNRKCPPVISNAKCPQGPSYSKDECNRCYCDLKSGISYCTLVACSTVDYLSKLPEKQVEKNKKLKQKIKEAVTGCTPPEAILIGNCRCDCRLPGVAVCNESCFMDKDTVS